MTRLFENRHTFSYLKDLMIRFRNNPYQTILDEKYKGNKKLVQRLQQRL